MLGRAATAEIVYDNLSNSLGTSYAALNEEGKLLEFGDEVVLGGTARILKSFTFDYYGEFVRSPNRTARIRMYANDSPAETLAPGTVLYDSGAFELRPGYLRVTIYPPASEVPNRLTWTVLFEGFTQNKRAGSEDWVELMLFDPPTVGRVLDEGKVGSYDDCWVLDGTWKTVRANVPLNMAASIRAEKEMLEPLRVVSAADGKSFQVLFQGAANASYEVQSSADGAVWTVLGTMRTKQSGTATFVHRPSDGVQAAHYRAVRLLVPPAAPVLKVGRGSQAGRVRISWAGTNGQCYQLRYSEDLQVWHYLSTVLPTFGLASYEDTPPLNGPVRFYGVMNPW